MSTDVRDTAGHDWIEGQRRLLNGQLEAQTAHLMQLTADTGDPADAHDRAALIVAARQSLAQTTEALRRIADGSYDNCQKCGDSIPRERLEVLPHARFCVPCQQRHGG